MLGKLPAHLKATYTAPVVATVQMVLRHGSKTTTFLSPETTPSLCFSHGIINLPLHRSRH